VLADEPTASHDEHDGTMRTMNNKQLVLHRVHRVIVPIVMAVGAFAMYPLSLESIE
jgi:hypothetical protein